MLLHVLKLPLHLLEQLLNFCPQRFLVGATGCGGGRAGTLLTLMFARLFGRLASPSLSLGLALRLALSLRLPLGLRLIALPLSLAVGLISVLRLPLGLRRRHALRPLPLLGLTILASVCGTVLPLIACPLVLCSLVLCSLVLRLLALCSLLPLLRILLAL